MSMGKILLRRCLMALVLVPALAAGLVAQEEGVRLGLLYQTQYQPGLVVLPFAASNGATSAAEPIRAIIRQNLDFSDQFEIRDAGEGVNPREPVNTRLWKERGADWIVQGDLAPRGGGYSLRVRLHDVFYGSLKGDETFVLPPTGDPNFRMAVHAVSDEIFRWATGQPGMAATRIAFVLQGRGSKEIYVVDYDGENVQRLTNDGSIALSPTWSPDGSRIAYTSYRNGTPRLYERNLQTGRDRMISDRLGVNITPAYSPDGRTLAFATTVNGNTEIATFDLERNCCLQQHTQGRRFDSLSPHFSPDGSQMVFVSNRTGDPHIFTMRVGSSEARMVSPFESGRRSYNTSPEWSPTGRHIVFHTRMNGVPQLVVMGANGDQPRLLTNEGANEDPSWAPNGRHVVFASPNRDGGGLFVVDTVTGRVRPLLRGRGYGLPAWSGIMARATTEATTRGQ
jgi:TolB protein